MIRTASLFGLAVAAFLQTVVSAAIAEGENASEAVELRLTDGSLLKATLREPRLVLKTPYGALTIPIADVVRVEFASRVPDDVARRVAELASTDFRTRQAAHDALERMGGRAFTALSGAANRKDPEVSRRAKDLLQKLQENAADEPGEVRKEDVVYTANSKFAGRIEAEIWRAQSVALGEVQVRLSELRELRTPRAEQSEAESGNALPDPGNLTSLQAQIGKRFVFKVTGAIAGSVWGTDVYTGDTNLATAAVHAGVLRVGQTGLVRVKIVTSPASYTGSARNGVTSQDYTAYPGAFQILRPRP